MNTQGSIQHARFVVLSLTAAGTIVIDAKVMDHTGNVYTNPVKNTYIKKATPRTNALAIRSQTGKEKGYIH